MAALDVGEAPSPPPSQHTLFNGYVQPGTIVPQGSMRYGLSMEQLLAISAQALSAQKHLPGLAVTPEWGVLDLPGAATPAWAAPEPDSEADGFTRRLARALREAEADGAHLLVNLKRWLPSEKAQPTAHWSPLAGFAERGGPDGGEPYALLLDVAAPAIGPHWLPLRVLAACMCTANMHGAPRGYLSIASST